MTNAITKPCTKAEAKAITERIRKGVDELWSLLMEAHERKAWKILRYDTWAEYVQAEFGMGRQHSYRLLDQGRVIRAIEEATGVLSPMGDISERDARDLKPDLPAVTEEIRTRVEAGEKPGEATAEVIAAMRAAKEEAKRQREEIQAENDRRREATRAQLNPAIKRSEEAKARNGSVQAAVTGKPSELASLNDALNAKVEEQADYITSLEAEAADLKSRFTKFDDMVTQWEQGGFEAVMATKDERIRALQRQVEDISADRASLAKSREYWKKQAIALGYVSPNERTEQPAEEYEGAAPF